MDINEMVRDMTFANQATYRAAHAEGRRAALTDAIRLVEKAKCMTVTAGGRHEPPYAEETPYIDRDDLVQALCQLRDAP